MITTLSLFELYKIVGLEHKDPHSVLGMHEVTHNGCNMVAVRVFAPQAMSIKIIDNAEPDNIYYASKIHDDGVFEAVITDRTKWFSYKLEVTDFNGGKSIMNDSYSFPPTLSEYDRYLYGVGNHYEIYKKLGAHLHYIDGNKGVAFAVWAPNAKSVSVIGNFNEWDGRRSQMRLLGNSGIWEFFSTDVSEGDTYKFCIKQQNNAVVNKSDPYGFYSEVRPQAASIVYDLNKYKWNDSKWIETRDKINIYESPMNVYEVHLGSWRRVPEDGDRFLSYSEDADLLVKYAKDMGYTHIELMPIEEHPFDGSWGYQVTGYYAPTSRYGNPDEFRSLVDACHNAGIGVILDWVPAHFPKDSHGLARFDGTALYEHEDPRRGEHKEWGTYVFNYGRNEVKNFLIANAIFWIEEYHLDGLRVDAVASMLYLDYCREEGDWLPNIYGGRENIEAVEFIKHMNSVIRGKYPSVMMIAEESTSWDGVTRDTKYNGLGFNFKWNMGWMNDFLTYVKRDPIYRKFHHNNITFSMSYTYSENFILVLSHDEVVHMKGSMINKMPGDMWQKMANLRVSYGFMYGHPGKKLIFMGDEIGQFQEWSEERSVDWHLLENEQHKKLHLYMKELNEFYKNNPALWRRDCWQEGFSWIECDDAQNSVVSFARMGTANDRMLVIICNFTPQVYYGYRLGVPQKGVYEEAFSSDKEKYGGTGIENSKQIISEEIPWNRCANSVTIDVPPLGIMVFAMKNEEKN